MIISKLYSYEKNLQENHKQLLIPSNEKKKTITIMRS